MTGHAQLLAGRRLISSGISSWANPVILECIPVGQALIACAGYDIKGYALRAQAADLLHQCLGHHHVARQEDPRQSSQQGRLEVQLQSCLIPGAEGQVCRTSSNACNVRGHVLP